LGVKDKYQVKEISYSDTKDFILNKHYAQRMPSITYAYGLYNQDMLCGVLTIGKPASHSLCVGVCGKEHHGKVFELNRLITKENLEKNALSYFVSQALKNLNQLDLVIVSYADEGMNHHGYIYQATNFIYTGKTKGRTDKYTEGNKHSRHYTNDNKHLRKFRTPKHRYIYFTKKKSKLRKKLKYQEEDYPKGDNKKYRLGERMKTKVINKDTAEVFYV